MERNYTSSLSDESTRPAQGGRGCSGIRNVGGGVGGGRYLIPCLDFLNYVLLGKVGHTLQKMRE